MKKNLFLTAILVVFLIGILPAQYVGINTAEPKTSLQIDAKDPATKISGLLIPRLTGDEIYGMPIPTGADLESTLVYATSAASTANQTGKGEFLKGKGFFYWDGTAWVSIDTSTTTINEIWAMVKPMNFVYGDNTQYVSPTYPFTVPNHPNVKHLAVDFGAGDLMIENNPLPTDDPNDDPANKFVMWNSTTGTIMVPEQLLGYAIGVTISLKYVPASSNSEASRVTAYTGNAIVDSNGIYQSGGTKIKDLFLKRNPVNGEYIRDELVMNPIIVTQEIINHGIKIFIGSGGNQSHNYFEPVITVNYGLVNVAQ